MISGGQKHTKHIDKSSLPGVYLYEWIAFMGIGILLLFSSCKDESSIKTQGLNGKWEIYKANRNDKETPYLRGGYFIFDAKGNLTINITGEDESNPYQIRGNVIVIEGKSDYTITSLRNDSMDIHYEMNPESIFMFFLKKTKNEKH